MCPDVLGAVRWSDVWELGLAGGPQTIGWTTSIWEGPKGRVPGTLSPHPLCRQALPRQRAPPGGLPPRLLGTGTSSSPRGPHTYASEPGSPAPNQPNPGILSPRIFLPLGKRRDGTLLRTLKSSSRPHPRRWLGFCQLSRTQDQQAPLPFLGFLPLGQSSVLLDGPGGPWDRA